ncbi:MAG TPA: BON domain-containing protein [Gemmatimonadales bacterium]|nr:BON domain-containing protein [Gemmatimonadales bacterium]
MTKKESKRGSAGEPQFGAERRVAPGHSPVGVGPLGRRRSDDALAADIHEILTQDPELDTTEIEVEVAGGAVTLMGTVDSGDARMLAEELVESLTGVREVHNRLRVAR